MPVLGRISPRGMKFELPFDVGEHGTAGAQTKQMRLKPMVAQFFFHQDQPFKRLFGGANAAGGFESYGHAGGLGVFADGAGHDETDGQNRVHGFLAGGSLDEVGASHHGDETGAGDIAKSEQIAGAKNYF